MRNKLICSATCLLLATACSEATDGIGASPGSTSSSGAAGAGGTGAAGGSTSSAGGGSGGTVDITGLVINELSGAGDDYIELFNGAAAAVSLDGVRVADDDGGVPKVAEAVTLEGSVAPGEYVFILADLGAMALPGLQQACGPGTSPCFQASFGLSAGNGDAVYVLSPNDAILLQEPYPANVVVDGQSWGRLPNGTGGFTVNQPTPGDVNAAP